MDNFFDQHDSSFTEDQHTHSLSTDRQFLRSTLLERDGGSTHSRAVNGSVVSSVSMAAVRRMINRHTVCKQQLDMNWGHFRTFPRSDLNVGKPKSQLVHYCPMMARSPKYARWHEIDLGRKCPKDNVVNSCQRHAIRIFAFELHTRYTAPYWSVELR